MCFVETFAQFFYMTAHLLNYFMLMNLNVFVNVFLWLVIFCETGFGQNTSVVINTDSIILNEIRNISVIFPTDYTNSNCILKGYKEIKLKNYDDSTLIFTARNWSGTSRYIKMSFEHFNSASHQIVYNNDFDSIVSIDGKAVWGVSTHPPVANLKKIVYFRFSHALVEFPVSAFEGIYESSIPWSTTLHEKRNLQRNYKVYISPDKSRTYICMLNGSGKDRYQVIWVVTGLKYYGRFIEKIHG